MRAVLFQDYITFSSWWDELIVTGILPLSSLVVFNSRIYLKLRASDRQEYRFVGRKRPVACKESETVRKGAYFITFLWSFVVWQFANF